MHETGEDRTHGHEDAAERRHRAQDRGHGGQPEVVDHHQRLEGHHRPHGVAKDEDEGRYADDAIRRDQDR